MKSKVRRINSNEKRNEQVSQIYINGRGREKNGGMRKKE